MRRFLGSRTIAPLCALTTALIGGLYLLVDAPRRRAAVEADASAELLAASDLAATSVEAWLARLRTDALTIADFPTTATALAGHMGPADRVRYVERALGAVLKHGGYERLEVLGADLAPVITLGAPRSAPEPLVVEVVEEAVARGEAVVELRRLREGPQRVLVACPAPLGAVLLEADPERWLYPFLRALRRGRTGEAHLVRPGADLVELLSPLRHVDLVPGGLRLPRLAELPGAGALGPARTGRFLDYRGASVLAATHALAGSPWGLVVKQDEAEVLEPYAAHLRLQGAMWAAIAVAVGTIVLAAAWRVRASASAALAEADARLAAQAAPLRALFDSSLVGMFFGDVTGGIQDANDTYLRLVGLGRSDVVAGPLSWKAMTPAEWLPAHEAAIREAQRRGSCAPYEAQLVRKDGARLWVLVSFVLLPPDRTRGVVLVLDVDASRTAAEELRGANLRLEEAQARLRKLSRAVEQSPVSIVITDPQGVIEYVNPRFEAATGWTLAEVVGKTPRVLKSGKTDPRVYEQMWATIRGGAEWRGELENRRKDGQPLLESVVISPIRDADGAVTHFVGIKQDVSSERRSEEQLRELNHLLLQSQKMEAIGRLAGGVAHDYNNVLTVIAGYTQMVAEGLPEEAPARRKLEQVLRASERAAALTRQLLAFSRKLPAQPRVLELAALVREAEGMLRRVLPETITLRLTLAPAEVRIDPVHLEQVLLNLVINARDATPAGGLIEVEAGAVAPDPALLARHGAPTGETWARVSVRDDGEGMDAETKARLFEPFFTTKTQGKGTGLGLATVYGIVKQAGGFIEVESSPGQGARFDVYLPRMDVSEPAAPDAVAVEASPVARGDGQHVLVVEDEAPVLELVREVLERRGFRVHAVSRPEEGLAIVERDDPHVDLLLTDVVMPGMDGRTLAERARARRPDLPVLFMSGYAQEGLEVLAKPLRPAALVEAVLAALSPRV